MPLEEWLFPGEPVNEEKINEIEELFGFMLPDDFKACVMKNNGAYPRPNAFDCDDGSTEAVFNDLISFTDDDLNISMFFEFAALNLIPFGRDPFGNLLCFDYRMTPAAPAVVFHNHEEKGDAAISPVCDTFTTLLNRLYD